MLKDRAWQMLKAAGLVLLIAAVGIVAVTAVQYYEPSKRDAVQEANNQSEAKAVDILSSERVAYYTKVLAIFTGILSAFGLLQIWFVVRADRTASVTAKAAKLSADAAVAIELPFIRVNAPDELTKVETIEDDTGGLIWDVETPALPEFSRLYEIEFRNIGRTTAAPIKLELGWKVALPLTPEQPVYTWSRRCGHGTVLPSDNQPYKLECTEFCIVLTAHEREMIFANKSALWVFGALTYLDFLEESRTVRFCWRWGCPDGVGLYYFYTDEQTPAQYRAKS